MIALPRGLLVSFSTPRSHLNSNSLLSLSRSGYVADVIDTKTGNVLVRNNKFLDIDFDEPWNIATRTGCNIELPVCEMQVRDPLSLCLARALGLISKLTYSRAVNLTYLPPPPPLFLTSPAACLPLSGWKDTLRTVSVFLPASRLDAHAHHAPHGRSAHLCGIRHRKTKPHARAMEPCASLHHGIEHGCRIPRCVHIIYAYAFPPPHVLSSSPALVFLLPLLSTHKKYPPTQLMHLTTLSLRRVAAAVGCGAGLEQPKWHFRGAGASPH